MEMTIRAFSFHFSHTSSKRSLLLPFSPSGQRGKRGAPRRKEGRKQPGKRASGPLGENVISFFGIGVKGEKAGLMLSRSFSLLLDQASSPTQLAKKLFRKSNFLPGNTLLSGDFFSPPSLHPFGIVVCDGGWGV